MTHGYLTETTWTLANESRQFTAKFHGIDALAGVTFRAGELIILASVDGSSEARPVSVRGMRMLDLRVQEGGRVVTRYQIVRPDTDTDALVARASHVTVMTRNGLATLYKRTGIADPRFAWEAPGGFKRTDAQVRAIARKAYAIMAQGA